ncbi:hypothetical protein A9Q84_19160 [Halobacteriovorax marinus]|uniref:Uncharacterized protein n=1 Tax=Halobacteriovorax marinus TaxID=97084 RepID=A0A1Y5F6A9_9BACT|nr:hypothetical protein A9Q84_19160 [Halobacteriovorax marinus]
MVLDYVQLRKEFEELKKKERRGIVRTFEDELDLDETSQNSKEDKKKQAYWEHLMKKIAK